MLSTTEDPLGRVGMQPLLRWRALALSSRAGWWHSAPYRAGFFGTVVEYGAERKISRHSVLGAAVSIGVPQGVSLKVK